MSLAWRIFHVPGWAGEGRCGLWRLSPEQTLGGRFPDNAPMTSQEQPRNPLHGLTLERIVTDLVDYYGWRELGRRVPVRCFNLDPSISSSLKFLRKTPWAREQVEQLYVQTQRADEREQQRRARRAERSED
ncbi:uncharacterized protein DUF2132 [Comamonas sp. AG1104]|nr:uncharacterized protein DUF2132 [Comamonas sp. AG1104]